MDGSVEELGFGVAEAGNGVASEVADDAIAGTTGEGVVRDDSSGEAAAATAVKGEATAAKGEAAAAKGEATAAKGEATADKGEAAAAKGEATAATAAKGEVTAAEGVPVAGDCAAGEDAVGTAPESGTAGEAAPSMVGESDVRSAAPSFSGR